MQTKHQIITCGSLLVHMPLVFVSFQCTQALALEAALERVWVCVCVFIWCLNEKGKEEKKNPIMVCLCASCYWCSPSTHSIDRDQAS
jgi:hypothetical protein